MIRVKISNFIKKHENKIKDLGSKLVIVAMVVFIATIMLSFNRIENLEEEEKNKEIYKPTETIISGSNILEEQYQKDSNAVNKFLEFCNNKELESAYNLLSDVCKEELYPSIEDFKKYYHEKIFDKKREYNLQSWISTSKYTVYKIRYTNSMLSTGTYNENDVYQDYITIDKNSDEEKISVGNLIYSEDCNIVTKTDEIESTVAKKIIYISYEEYEIKVRNISDKTILLDTLESGQKIRLIGNGTPYFAYTNKLFLTNLTINPNEIKTITIRFNKNLSSNNQSERIEFLNVIKDYDLYQQNKENYTDTITIKIKVED